MPVTNHFHERVQRRANAGKPLQHDSLPTRLRVQLHRIISGALGGFYENSHMGLVWTDMVVSLRDSVGAFKLSAGHGSKEEFLRFLIEADKDRALSAVEVACQTIERCAAMDPMTRDRFGMFIESAEAIEQINARLLQAGCGYRYLNGAIVEIDSEVVLREVVEPALALVSDSRFQGANDEYNAALRHLRAGDFKSAVVEAHNAFESALKSICTIHGWEFAPKARASDLLKTVREGGLYQAELSGPFEQLVGMLKGLSDLRNNNGSHGAGETPKPIAREFAAHAINLAGINIVFLCELSLRLQAPHKTVA